MPDSKKRVVEEESLETQRAEYDSKISSLSQSKAVYQQECRFLQKKFYQSQRIIEGLKQEAIDYAAQTQSKIDTLTQQIAMLDADVGQKEQEIRQLQMYLQEIGAQKEQLQQELSVKTQQIEEQSVIQAKLDTELYQIKANNNTLSLFQAQYCSACYAAWLVPVWRRYFGEHFGEIDEKKQALKLNLDKESEHIIDLLCLRNFEILPQQRDADKFLYCKNALYEPWELEGLSHTRFAQEFSEKHSILGDHILETTVVEFYNGLKLLPERVQTRLTGCHIIDGGACWGDSMLAFSEYKPAMIHCFEPDSDNFDQLKITAQTNKLEEIVQLNPVGLSNVSHSATLYSCEYPSCSSISNETLQNINGQEKEAIHLTSIDEYVEKNKISVGLIKLDIEGAESAAIQGAKKTILRDRPILLISVYHTPKDFFEIKPLIESWGVPYHFSIRKTTYQDLIAEVMLIGFIDEK